MTKGKGFGFALHLCWPPLSYKHLLSTQTRPDSRISICVLVCPHLLGSKPTVCIHSSAVELESNESEIPWLELAVEHIVGRLKVFSFPFSTAHQDEGVLTTGATTS